MADARAAAEHESPSLPAVGLCALTGESGFVVDDGNVVVVVPRNGRGTGVVEVKQPGGLGQAAGEVIRTRGGIAHVDGHEETFTLGRKFLLHDGSHAMMEGLKELSVVGGIRLVHELNVDIVKSRRSPNNAPQHGFHDVLQALVLQGVDSGDILRPDARGVITRGGRARLPRAPGCSKSRTERVRR